MLQHVPYARAGADPVSVRRRSPILDYPLIVLGAVAALAGLYFQSAPSDWWLAHFSEAYQYGGYTLGGLLLSAGFGMYADRAVEEDGHPSARSATGLSLAVIAVVGAAVAALFWIL